MTHKQTYILIVLLIAHTVFSFIGTRKLIKSKVLTKKQIRLNLIFLWLVPLFWYLIVDALHKRNPGSHEVPKKGNISDDVFHESDIGTWG